MGCRKYLGGAVGSWAAIELLVLVSGWWNQASYQTRAGILLGYLQRSNTERIMEVFHQFIFPIYLWHFSAVVSLVFLGWRGLFVMDGI